MVKVFMIKNNVYWLLLIAFSASGILNAQEKITVMSYNVRYDEAVFNEGKLKENDWVNRKDAQIKLLAYFNPDIIGMQEPFLHQVKYFEHHLSKYDWIGNGREDGKVKGEYNPVFYNRERFELIESGTFWLSETPCQISKSWDAGYTRICTWGLFESRETQDQFYVFNTHFDSTGANARYHSAQLINKKVKEFTNGKPVIITGDFNFNPESSAYEQLTSNGLSDSRIVSKSIPYGPKATFNAFQDHEIPKERIDYVFVGNNIEVLSYSVLNNSYNLKFPSDHFPVLIKVQL